MTFDDDTDVKSTEKPDTKDRFHGSRAASSGGLLPSNNDLNRLNGHMNHHILINICIFEQSEELLFSYLSVPLNRATQQRVVFMVRIFCYIKLFTIFKIWHQFKKI